jgi:ABC-type nitrate/sulfonate/bicarbonate transport system permease component
MANENDEKKKAARSAFLKALYLFSGFLLLAGIWDIISFSSSGLVFPEFFLTLGRSFALLGEREVLEGLGASILRIIIVLAIATALGSLLGLLSAFFPPLEEIFKPLIYFLTAFPTASMIFVLIIFTPIACYLLVGFLTFPIIYKAALGGGKIVKGKYEDQMKIDGEHRQMNFFQVLLPLSLPYIFMGLGQASGLALKAEIMGEVFMSVTSFKGIGVLINDAYLSVDYARLLSLTMLAILTMSLVDAVTYFAKRYLNNKFGVEPVKVFRLY